MYSIGVDIGGMSIKVGLVDEDGSIIIKNRATTEKNPEKAIEILTGQIESILKEKHLEASDIKGIGIGCPGFSNSEKGIIDIFSNVGWKNVPIKDMLLKHFNTRIELSNDANAAMLGEMVFGAAKGYKNCVSLILGTGVGGGIIIDGKLFEGFMSKGAELGHISLIMNGRPCPCGRNGCLEQYASATALIRQTKEAMLADKNSKMWEYVGGDIEKVDGKTAFECSKSGDASAEKVIDNFVAFLGEGALTVFNIFRPEILIIGGGISAQGDYLIAKLKAYCKKYKYGFETAPETVIKVASLGNDAGIIGAASLLSR